jgi:hypothetical protein
VTVRRKLLLAGGAVALAAVLAFGWIATRDDAKREKAASICPVEERWIDANDPNVQGTITPENSGSAMICVELPPNCQVYTYELHDRTWVRAGPMTAAWADEQMRACREAG